MQIRIRNRQHRPSRAPRFGGVSESCIREISNGAEPTPFSREAVTFIRAALNQSGGSSVGFASRHTRPANRLNEDAKISTDCESKLVVSREVGGIGSPTSFLNLAFRALTGIGSAVA